MTMTVPISDLTPPVTMRVTVMGMRRFRIRLALAMFLLRIVGCLISRDSTVEMDFTNDG